MKTFRGKSSQRPLIRSGSEWPLYLGLGPMKAFLAGAERDRPCLASFPKCSLAPEPTTTTSSSLDITNMDHSETNPQNTDCSHKYQVPLNSTLKKEQNFSMHGAVKGHSFPFCDISLWRATNPLQRRSSQSSHMVPMISSNPGALWNWLVVFPTHRFRGARCLLGASCCLQWEEVTLGRDWAWLGMHCIKWRRHFMHNRHPPCVPERVWGASTLMQVALHVYWVGAGGHPRGLHSLAR